MTLFSRLSETSQAPTKSSQSLGGIHRINKLQVKPECLQALVTPWLLPSPPHAYSSTGNPGLLPAYPVPDTLSSQPRTSLTCLCSSAPSPRHPRRRSSQGTLTSSSSWLPNGVTAMTRRLPPKCNPRLIPLGPHSSHEILDASILKPFPEFYTGASPAH